jgi:hypothetical protein
MTATAELADLNTTVASRGILSLADVAGLNPHLDEDGVQGNCGVARVVVNGGGRNGLFGAIYLSVQTGQVLYANLTHGNRGEEKRYTGANEVRKVLASWLAVSR